MFNSSRFLTIGFLLILNIEQPSAFAQAVQSNDLPKNAKRGQVAKNEFHLAPDDWNFHFVREAAYFENAGITE